MSTPLEIVEPKRVKVSRWTVAALVCIGVVWHELALDLKDWAWYKSGAHVDENPRIIVFNGEVLYGSILMLAPLMLSIVGIIFAHLGIEQRPAWMVPAIAVLHLNILFLILSLLPFLI